MQRPLLLTAVLVAAIGVVPWAQAGKESTTTVSDFSWSDGGQGLGLHSQTGSGVVVTRAEPEPFHGLRRGDVLLAANGTPLHQVEDLTRLLRGRTAPLALRVRRDRRLSTLVWSHADYRAFAPTAPPAPHF